MRVLETVQLVAEQTPPVDNAQSRFGNPAFRTFYDELAEHAPALLKGIDSLKAEDEPLLTPYFVESWGNRTRIDYGSGMELNFLCLLCAHDPVLKLRLRPAQVLTRQAGLAE